MKIRIGMNGNEITATLIDNATSRDFVSLLPLELKLENYGSRKDKLFAEETIYGGSASGQRHFGWGCYYAPWGNLALFRSDFRYSSGLIKLEESTLV